MSLVWVALLLSSAAAEDPAIRRSRATTDGDDVISQRSRKNDIGRLAPMILATWSSNISIQSGPR